MICNDSLVHEGMMNISIEIIKYIMSKEPKKQTNKNIQLKDGMCSIDTVIRIIKNRKLKQNRKKT